MSVLTHDYDPSQAVRQYLRQVQYLLQVTSSYKLRYTPVSTSGNSSIVRIKEKIHTIKRDTIVLL